MNSRGSSAGHAHAESEGTVGKFVGRIAAISAILVAVGGLLDAVVAVTTKTMTLTCNLRISFPWCPASDVPELQRAANESPQTRVNAFVIMAYSQTGPAGGMPSARRDLKRATPDRWIETYPTGTSSYFDVIGRATLGDCSGTVARNQISKSHRVFIPDKGCPGMPFYISDDDKNWGIASAMTDVQ
jgi:hypothetical protein